MLPAAVDRLRRQWRVAGAGRRDHDGGDAAAPRPQFLGRVEDRGIGMIGVRWWRRAGSEVTIAAT